LLHIRILVCIVSASNFLLLPVCILVMFRTFPAPSDARGLYCYIKQQNSIAEKYDFVKYDIETCPHCGRFWAKIRGLGRSTVMLNLFQHLWPIVQNGQTGILKQVQDDTSNVRIK